MMTILVNEWVNGWMTEELSIEKMTRLDEWISMVWRMNINGWMNEWMVGWQRNWIEDEKIGIDWKPPSVNQLD